MRSAVPVRYRDAVCISVLMLISLLLWIPRLRGPLDLRYDAGVYYILGTSLAEGKGYRLLNEPGAIQAIQYPPLLPLFAAAHQLLAGSSDPAVAGHLLRLSFFAIFMIFIAAVYRLSRCYLTSGVAFLAALVVILHVHTTWMSELLFAELPFALLSVLFLLVARRREGRGKWLAGILAVSCFLLRSAGIALLGAWVGESLLKRRFKEMALRATVALVPFLAWQGYIAYVTQGPEYTRPAYEYQRAGYQFYNVKYSDNLAYIDPFQPEKGMATPGIWLNRIVSNLVLMPESLGAAVSVRQTLVARWLRYLSELTGAPWEHLSRAKAVYFLILGTLVLFGLVRLALHGELIVTLYVTGSCVLMCMTPWPGQYDRYLWPLNPLLVIALFTALVTIRNRFSKLSRGKLRSVGAVILATVAFGVLSAELLALRKSYELRDTAFYTDARGRKHEYDLFFYTPDWKDHAEALEWLRRHANPQDILATSTPHWAFLKTGLQAVMPPFEADSEEAQRLMDSVPVHYLILDNLSFVDISRRYAAGVVEAFPERWELVYSSPADYSMIYRRKNGIAIETTQNLLKGSH